MSKFFLLLIEFYYLILKTHIFELIFHDFVCVNIVIFVCLLHRGKR